MIKKIFSSLIPKHHRTSYEIIIPPIGFVKSDWWSWLGKVFNHKLTQAN